MSSAPHIAPFAGLSARDVFDLLQLRAEAFVVEQNCVYLDPDGRDVHPGTLHLLVRGPGERLDGYLRILAPDLPGAAAPGGHQGQASEGEVLIGRVVVHTEARRRGLAQRMMEAALERIQADWPGRPMALHAQVYLQEFYRRHGFETCSEPYLLDGLAHIDMRRPAGAGEASAPPV
ncbi:MAG: GNAT family N-acetyltransferase [Planctomycetota bacterium]